MYGFQRNRRRYFLLFDLIRLPWNNNRLGLEGKLDLLYINFRSASAVRDGSNQELWLYMGV